MRCRQCDRRNGRYINDLRAAGYVCSVCDMSFAPKKEWVNALIAVRRVEARQQAREYDPAPTDFVRTPKNMQEVKSHSGGERGHISFRGRTSAHRSWEDPSDWCR